jgi:hypothetical protein
MSTHTLRGNIMPRKITAAIVGSCAHTIAKRWALQNGLQEWEAAALAWVASAAVSAVVLRA